MRRHEIDRTLPGQRGGKGWFLGLALAGAVLGAPAVASAVIRRRAEPPQAPRWGRARRYASHSGEIVFQELGHRRADAHDAPPVVLLHALGPGYDSQQWRAAAEILADGRAVYVPDLPGWGRSQAARGHAPAPHLYVAALEDFLTEVVREPAVVVAAGHAAPFAVRVAVENPRAVRALGLVCPVGLAGADRQPGDGFVARLLRLPVLKDTVLDLLTGRSALEHHLRREVYAAPERVDAALLDHHYRASHLARARGIYAAWLRGDLWKEVSAEELAQIQAPVWLAWGRAAAEPPVERADLWLRQLPAEGTEIDILEGSGSLPHAETPAVFTRALERFLTRIRG
jgi:pimeloyl-ACP methyl ester carboxylesterase